jgi:signal transduction histidine kinase
LGLDELTRRVRALPDDHVILFLIYFADDNGRDYVPAEAATELCNASPVPVFGLYKTLLSHGVLGGHMVDFDAQATETGRMARRVLDGEQPSGLPMHGHEMNQPLLHWQRLQHWHIPETNIPSHAIVLNRVPTFWERYGWQLGAICGLISLPLTLGVALLLSRQRRRHAEQALEASRHDVLRQRDQLARVSRIATVEEMSTSIAHEVNQPLSAIVSNARAALRMLAQQGHDTKEIIAALEDIAKDGNRAADILERVRSLTQKQQQTLAPLDLNEVVRNVLRLARPDAKARGIVIRQQLQDGLPHVNGDPIELQQVILNLLINGAQAMRDVAPNMRELTIRTAVDNGVVHLSVQDCGVGLDEDQIDRVFAPFFTTKPSGIGMGLSISNSIIEAHDGRIWATKNPERGATFHVTLPVEV